MTVAVTSNDGNIRLYETLTWGLRHVAPAPGIRLTFTADSRHVLVGGLQSGTVRRYDWRVPALGESWPGPATPEEAWQQLSSADAAVAFRAAVVLARTPRPSLGLFTERLKPLHQAERGRVERLLADLGAESFRTRESASAEVAKVGPPADPFLQHALNSSNPEVVARAGRLLRVLDPRANPERLRYARAIELLEYWGTPAAVELLRILAAGDAAFPETARATAARERIAALGPR